MATTENTATATTTTTPADWRATWITPQSTRTSGTFPDMTPDQIRVVIVDSGGRSVVVTRI